MLGRCWSRRPGPWPRRRPAARLLCPHPSQTGPSGRRRRGGAQAGGALPARAHQGTRLPLGATGLGRQQDPRHGVAGRQAAKEGQSARSGLRLQHQGAAELGATTGSAGGTQLRPLRRSLANASTKGRGARAPQSGKERIGRLAALAADAPRFATRSLAHPKNNTLAQKALVDLIRRVRGRSARPRISSQSETRTIAGSGLPDHSKR